MMADDLDLQRFRTFGLGGYRLVKGHAMVLVFTALDGDRRLAVAYVNPDHPDAEEIADRDYLPAVVMRIKQERGWDYTDYDLYVSPPNCPDYERIQWSRDPFTGEPSFGPFSVFVREEDMVRHLNSFRVPDGVIPHFHDADLSQNYFSPSPQIRSDRAFMKLREAAPPQSRYDIRPFAEYSVGDPPLAFAATLFDGRNRMAIISANPKHPSASDTSWQLYTGQLATIIKQSRGWEYGQYDLFVKQWPDWPFQKVTVTRDPAGAPTISSKLDEVDVEVLNAAIRSFPIPAPAHFHAADLAGFHVHPGLDPE